MRGRGAAATSRLQIKRQQAIESLMKAKSALAKLNAQRRQTQRLNVVNKKRGLQVFMVVDTFLMLHNLYIPNLLDNL